MSIDQWYFVAMVASVFGVIGAVVAVVYRDMKRTRDETNFINQKRKSI